MQINPGCRLVVRSGTKDLYTRNWSGRRVMAAPRGGRRAAGPGLLGVLLLPLCRGFSVVPAPQREVAVAPRFDVFCDALAGRWVRGDEMIFEVWSQAQEHDAARAHRSRLHPPPSHTCVHACMHVCVCVCVCVCVDVCVRGVAFAGLLLQVEEVMRSCGGAVQVRWCW